MVATSITLYIVYNKLVAERIEAVGEEAAVVLHVQPKKRKYTFLVTIGKFARVWDTLARTERVWGALFGFYRKIRRFGFFMRRGGA